MTISRLPTQIGIMCCKLFACFRNCSCIAFRSRLQHAAISFCVFPPLGCSLFLRIIYIETPHRAPVCHGLPLPSLQGDGVVGTAGSIESSGLDEVE